MLARASSDAGIRLRRSKSTSTVQRHAPPISEPLDREVAQQHALAAATAAYARAQGHDTSDRKPKRSSDTTRSKSNASRKSLTSQGSHFPPRESGSRSMQPQKPAQISASYRPTRAPIVNTEQFPPFYPTPSSDRPVSLPRPLSAQPSITFSENSRPKSQAKTLRQSASSSATSQQLRKARSMYYASSIQTGSPIARPPAQYLTTPPPISVTPALDPPPALPHARTLRPSPLAELRIPVTVAADETIDKARDKYLQSFQQKTVKHKPSIFLAPFKKRQDKANEKTRRSKSGTASGSISRSSQRTADESMVDSTLNDFYPPLKEKRSFSGSLKNKFRRVFRRASSTTPNLPVQQIEASREYFGESRVNPTYQDDTHAIPSPDEKTLQRVRSRTPSLEGSRPAFIRSSSRSSSNGSARSNSSNRSLHSETNATHASASRVTSWGTASIGDTLTQRAIKRLTVIHESKDSIGSEADRVASLLPMRKPLPLPALTAFRDPMPMEVLTEEVLTPVDPKRVFSALMREIGSSTENQNQSNPTERTPGAESDVFESRETKGLHMHTGEVHSSGSRDFRPSLSSDQRPPSRRPASAAAQSVQSKTSTIRSFGRAFRSTIRTVTPAEQRSSPCPDRTGSVRGVVRTPRKENSTPSLASDGEEEKINSSIATNTDGIVYPSTTQEYPSETYAPSAIQIEQRVAKAKDRWKTPLEEVVHPQFPRETDRTYNVATFTQQTVSFETTSADVKHIDESRINSKGRELQDTRETPTSTRFPVSPNPYPVFSPLSPSIYSRNTDGISILPNDSVISLASSHELEQTPDGGSAIILTSQSVRSYVIGTPSPRRPDSTRTSRDWKAWLSHEISGMEFTSQEDLRIDEGYATPSGKHRRDDHNASGGDQRDITAILRESNDVTTPQLGAETPVTADAPNDATRRSVTGTVRGPALENNVTASVPEKIDSHFNTIKEVSPAHIPTPPTDSQLEKDSSRPNSPPLLIRQRDTSSPRRHTSSSQQLETPGSSRMNDRFPFIVTSRRSSSNSVRSSCQSRSPADSVSSSLKSTKVTPSPRVYTDLSASAVSMTSQRMPTTTLKRSDAQHKRKENVTPPSMGISSKPSVSPLGLASRSNTQPLASVAPNRNAVNVGQHKSNVPEVKHVKHNSSPAATPARPRVRAVLRPISPEKLARRPQSAFDLRGVNAAQARLSPKSYGRPTLDTPLPRPASELRRPAIHLKTSSSSLALSKEPLPGTEERVIDSVLVERNGSVTPGQRMADRFLRERKSTPAPDSGKSMRGGLRLVREDTPAFL